MPYAESPAAGEGLQNPFLKRFRHPAPQAALRWRHDGERLVTFDPFPQDHWRHRRTTKAVESPVAVVRLRTTAAQRLKKVDSATAS
jgi:transposase-like protein